MTGHLHKAVRASLTLQGGGDKAEGKRGRGERKRKLRLEQQETGKQDEVRKEEKRLPPPAAKS